VRLCTPNSRAMRREEHDRHKRKVASIQCMTERLLPSKSVPVRSRNYAAASCEVRNPRLRTPGSRQFGGGIFVWHAHLRTTPTGRLGDAVANSLFHCLAAAHTGEGVFHFRL